MKGSAEMSTIVRTGWLLVSVLFPMSAYADQVRQEILLWQGTPPGTEAEEAVERIVERGLEGGSRDRSITGVHRPTLTIHLPEKTNSRSHAAMIICPGGGLSRVVIDKEGNDFARLLCAYGVAGLVLKFRTPSTNNEHYGMSTLEMDIKRAIRLTRAHAEQWNLDPQRIGVFGFSAGGILASTVATRYDRGNRESADYIEQESCRPDFLGLAYPLISLKQEICSENYRRLLFGNNPSTDRILKYSGELNVSEKTPPTFICHAEDDQAISIEHSQLFVEACRTAGVPCTTFFRSRGGHGYGVRKWGTPINQWPQAFVKWMQLRGISEDHR